MSEPGTERVRRRAFEPAVQARGDTAQHGTALVRRSQQRVETMNSPDGEQVGSRAAGDPEHVLVIHKGCEVLDDAFEEGQLGRTAVVAAHGAVEAAHAVLLIAAAVPR